MHHNKKNIEPEMTVLDIVSKFNNTIDVFEAYDKKAKDCICCNALFDSLRDVAKKYDLDIRELIQDLEKTIKLE